MQRYNVTLRSKDASGKRVSSAENVRLAAAIVGYGAVLHSSHSSRGLGLASKVFALAALREIASPVDYFVPDWHVDGKFA
jgi:hypothetical protein